MAELTIRKADESDAPAIIELLQSSMGWVRGEPNEALFGWKHQQNPFGASPSWIATDEHRVVAFRTMLRWEFLRDGVVVRAARAVDTVTHANYRGRGLFTTLTGAAVSDLRAEGVEVIFNTPNDNSRPGYLKMGWSEVGALRTWARLSHPRVLLRVVRSRIPAEIWSEQAEASLPGIDALDET